MSLAILLLSLLPIPFLIVLVTVMWRRKQHAVYPIFWAFLCFQVLTIASEFICKAISYKAFFYAYWVSSFLTLILQVVLLQDIFSRTLGKYPQLDRFRRGVFEVAFVASWITAVVVLLLAKKIHTISAMMATAELVMGIVAVTVFVFVATSAIVLGIRWKSALCGMAAGLGLLGTLDVLAFVIMIFSGRLSHHVTLASWVNTIAYNVAIGIFALYFIPTPQEVPPPKQVRPELLDWAESMRGSLPR